MLETSSCRCNMKALSTVMHICYLVAWQPCYDDVTSHYAVKAFSSITLNVAYHCNRSYNFARVPKVESLVKSGSRNNGLVSK